MEVSIYGWSTTESTVDPTTEKETTTVVETTKMQVETTTFGIEPVSSVGNLATNPTIEPPIKTGDSTNSQFWIIIAVLSAVLAGALLVAKKSNIVK